MLAAFDSGEVSLAVRLCLGHRRINHSNAVQVDRRLQPARDALRSLHSTCIPFAASAVARAAPPAPANSLDQNLGDAPDADVMAALRAGEQELAMLQELPADSGRHAAASRNHDTKHAGIAEAAVNVGALIVNSALSQVWSALSTCYCCCAARSLQLACMYGLSRHHARGCEGNPQVKVATRHSGGFPQAKDQTCRILWFLEQRGIF